MLTLTSILKVIKAEGPYGGVKRHHFGGPMDYGRHQFGVEPDPVEEETERRPFVEPTWPGWYRQRDPETNQFTDEWREKAGPRPLEPLEDDYLRGWREEECNFGYILYYSPNGPRDND